MRISFPLVSIVPKLPFQQTDGFIQIPIQLWEELQLEPNREINFLLGRKALSVQVKPAEISSNDIYVPEDFYHTFQLPIEKYNFRINYIPQLSTLHLGPIIGLLTDFSVRNGEPDFRSIQAFSEELHHGISENGGFFYIFACQQFQQQGFYFKNGNWQPAELPLPDVVYNRIHSRRFEQSQSFKKFRNFLEQLDIPLFNDRFLSKWEVYQQILKEKDSLFFVPETAVFTKESLLEFTRKYETVYIKPAHGSQGRNILKLKKEEQGQFSLLSSFKRKAAAAGGTFSLNEVQLNISAILKEGSYIIQQGIPLLTYENSPMDFRVLCHRNPEGSWDVTSVVARVAAEEEFVSNIARGGKSLKPLEVLHTIMEKRTAREVLANMKAAAIEIASTMCRQTQGIIGELGIDIGIDPAGNPWLIEVNSKPSKNLNDHVGKIRPSAKAIIKFCQSLAFDAASIKGEE